MSENAWPKELRVSKDKRSLTISFDDGEAFDLSAEYLRVTSPSAEVQGHSPAQRKTVPGKRDVEIMKMEPVGNYASPGCICANLALNIQSDGRPIWLS